MPDTLEAFWTAVKAGDTATVQTLLAADPALALARTASGVSAVLLAAYYGRAPLAQQILAAGGPADLFEASALGQAAQVGALLDAAPAQVNAFAADGFTALGLAAFFGHPAVLDLLLARGADPNLAANNPMNVRPLHSAVAHRDAATALALAETLLRHGAEANAQQEGGYTALHEAASSGHLPLARLLLARGANPALANAAGLTPHDLAEKHGHTEAAALLRAAVA